MIRNIIVSVNTIVFLFTLSASVYACSPPDSEETAPESAFQKTDDMIQFDPHWCTVRSATIGFGLGSASVSLEGIQDGKCVFTYMHEVEGGYSRYLCKVEQSDDPVLIKPTGLIEVQTSFDLDNCDLLGSGNMLLEMRKQSDDGEDGGL